MKNLRATDPTDIDQWRLLGRLGEGGQGVVYLGENGDGAKAAIKVFKEADTKFLGKELEAITQVSGQVGTASIVGTGDLDGLPYIATVYIDGPDLYTSVTQAGPIQGELLKTLAVATATSLAAIHRAGVVHRDFKPSNVLLGPDTPVVIDFGVAHLLESGGTTSNIVGTPSYAAPEQLAGYKAAPPADVFAWACTIGFAATGTPPFGADSIPAVMHRIMFAAPYLQGVPAALQPTLTACLAKDPAARPTAEQIVAHLLVLADAQEPGSQDVLAAAHTFITTRVLPSPGAAPARRHWKTAAATVAGGLVLAGAVLTAAALYSPSQPSTVTDVSPLAARPSGHAPSPDLAGQAGQPTASVPRTAAQYASHIMDAIATKPGCTYTHELDITQGDGLSKSTGTLYFNPGGATNYFSRVLYNDFSAGAGVTKSADVTTIGNTAYSLADDGSGRMQSWDVGPSGHGVPPYVNTAVEARWVSSPYTIENLLTHADNFSVSIQAGQFVLTGTTSTASMTDTPTGGLFREMNRAQVSRFQILVGSDYLPERVEIHFTDVPGLNVAAAGEPKAVATFTGWGLSGPITTP